MARRQFVRGTAVAAAGGLLAARPALAEEAAAEEPPAEEPPAEDTPKGLHLEQGGSTDAPEPTTVWSLQPTDPAKAPFQLVFAGASFHSTWDSVMYLGYNTPGSGRVIDSEPSFRFCIEQDYEVSPGEHWLEAYVEWIPGSSASAPAAGRPLFWRFDRSTGTIVGFDIKSKGVDFTHWDDDSNVFARIHPGGMNLGGRGNSRTTTLALDPPAGHGSAFNMRHGGQNALAISTNSESNVALSVNGHRTLSLFDRRASIGVADNKATLTLRDAFGGDVCIARAGSNGQAGQLFAARDSEGKDTHWRVGPRGYMFLAKTEPPTDAEVRRGECGFWFDAASGAPKLMVKAKLADGTVKSGEVPLT